MLQRPSNSTIGYDFRETSSSSHESVVKTIAKNDFENKNYTGFGTSSYLQALQVLLALLPLVEHILLRCLCFKPCKWKTRPFRGLPSVPPQILFLV